MAVTRLRFTVVSEALQGRQVELLADRPISVGRTKDNALVLDHKSVSRRHARIEPNDALADSQQHGLAAFQKRSNVSRFEAERLLADPPCKEPSS